MIMMTENLQTLFCMSTEYEKQGEKLDRFGPEFVAMPEFLSETPGLLWETVCSV